MPNGQFQQQYPGQQPAYPQQGYPQQQAQAAPMPQAQAAQPMPSGPVSMNALMQWAGIGGALSGAIQAAVSIVSGFNLVDMGITVVIGAVLGVLTGVLLGQFGAKVPIKGTLMIKSALFMFVITLAAGFVMGMGDGFTGLLLGIVGRGAGAFAYGWIIQKQLPNLI